MASCCSANILVSPFAYWVRWPMSESTRIHRILVTRMRHSGRRQIISLILTLCFRSLLFYLRYLFLIVILLLLSISLTPNMKFVALLMALVVAVSGHTVGEYLCLFFGLRELFQGEFCWYIKINILSPLFSEPYFR